MFHIHVGGIAVLLTVTIETDELAVFVETPKYLVVLDFDLIAYPPSTPTISHRIEFPRDEIKPDDAVADEDEYLK